MCLSQLAGLRSVEGLPGLAVQQAWVLSGLCFELSALLVAELEVALQPWLPYLQLLVLGLENTLALGELVWMSCPSVTSDSFR